MGENTKIEWAHHTFNPWIGCQRVSPGCGQGGLGGCYAEISTPVRVQRARGRELWGPKADRMVTSEGNWRKPLAWDRAAAAAGERHRVFCASLADVGEDRPDLVAPRARLVLTIQNTPHLDWLLLTKRVPDFRRLFSEHWGDRWPGNVWAGCTVENQEYADKRIPELLRVPAAVRFLSCEPLLGPVDLDATPAGAALQRCDGCGDAAREEYGTPCEMCDGLGRLGWVIAGGESGPHARPMHPDWARSLRDQCAAAGVPFLFKQWGEHVGGVGSRGMYVYCQNGHEQAGDKHTHEWGEGVISQHVGKKDAGRELDARTWDEVPAVARG